MRIVLFMIKFDHLCYLERVGQSLQYGRERDREEIWQRQTHIRNMAKIDKEEIWQRQTQKGNMAETKIERKYGRNKNREEIWQRQKGNIRKT